jgi:hypothetical protein
MIQSEFEGDGMDPGLGDLAYDGTEYELDEFGERVGSDEMFDDDDEMADEATGDTATDEQNLEDGFGETLNAPEVSDQMEDPKLGDAAQADYAEAGEASDASTEQSGESEMPKDSM